MTDKPLTAEALGKKLLQSVRQMKSGRAARTTRIEISPIIEARNAAGLTQAQFASLMGVSVRTLQEWEQGRRQPSGAARTVLRVALEAPEVLKKLAA